MVKKINPSRKMARNRLKNNKPGIILNPELVFGLVGPIGVNLDFVTDTLERMLRDVGYTPELIHLTKHMQTSKVRRKIDDSSYYKRYQSLIEYANEYRAKAGNPAAMAGLAITTIIEKRTEITNHQHGDGIRTEPALGTAYIVRQFKRPEEIALMRRVYGRKFIQISVFGSSIDRRKIIMEKISAYNHSPVQDSIREQQAIDLIDIDQKQQDNKNGQLLGSVDI